MTIREAARRLGLDGSTLRHQLKNGSLRGVRIPNTPGGRWYISEPEVIRYALEHRRVKSLDTAP